mmetsp:Transcript_146742/g.470924  ORF Transcript_146742/g.470924 Transcript_146742/m.470924 type:complete len:221 (+) Transcript_146742:1157-1819(+)
MLSGESLVGNVLFSDGFIDLHSVEGVPGEQQRLTTRWTLGFTFKLLPWLPQALFTGVSEYTIDSDAQVLTQRDYWDTLSLGRNGAYSPEGALAGLGDLGEQLLPSFLRRTEEPPAAVNGRWALLRRAAEYRVYRDVKDGRVFAIPAPGVSSEDPASSLARALREHGLAPGAALLTRPSGRGEVTVVEAAAAAAADRAADDEVPGVVVERPHPWSGEPPPE